MLLETVLFKASWVSFSWYFLKIFIGISLQKKCFLHLWCNQILSKLNLNIYQIIAGLSISKVQILNIFLCLNFIYLYTYIDKAKNYFNLIQTYIYKYMKFRYKNRFKIQTLLIDKAANKQNFKKTHSNTYVQRNEITITSMLGLTNFSCHTEHFFLFILLHEFHSCMIEF